MGVLRGGPGWGAVLLGAVLAGVTAALTNVWLPAAVGVGLASAAAIVVSVVTSRGANALTARGVSSRLVRSDSAVQSRPAAQSA